MIQVIPRSHLPVRDGVAQGIISMTVEIFSHIPNSKMHDNTRMGGLRGDVRRFGD